MEVIFSYTRAQALADGVLVDVSQMAREAGFVYPVALTSAVWSEYVAVPAGVEAQDEKGRLWDILWMLSLAAKRAKPLTGTLLFQLYVRNNNRSARLVTLKAVCGPSDDGSPCVTVMLPEED
jgi:hypothetical protein